MDLLGDAAEGLDHPVYYLCCASSFVEVCYRTLESSGVPEADISVEAVRGYGAAA